MTKEKRHWTARRVGDFLYKLGAEFVDQLDVRLSALGIAQKQLAHRANVSEGRVSQVFNDPGNLTLKSMVTWARSGSTKRAGMSSSMARRSRQAATV